MRSHIGSGVYLKIISKFNINHIKKIIISILAIVLVFGGVFAFYKNKNSKTVKKNDPLNITYKIKGVPYTLVNGKVEKEIAPGSASKEVVRVFGEPVYADLDGDSDMDSVMYLTQEAGGSGTFFYVVIAVNDNGIYKGTDAMFLGDRIAPQNITIQDGRAVANFAERKAGEPFTTPPSVGKSVWINLDAQNLKIGEWVKDFSGEADPKKMSLNMKVWQWISSAYGDGKKVMANSDKFKLTFKNDGTFSASTDCNGVGGGYKINGSQISFERMMSTEMYCEGSQESDFTKILSEANSFSFTGRGELIINFKNGSVATFR